MYGLRGHAESDNDFPGSSLSEKTMDCKFYTRLMLTLLIGVWATSARAALYLIPEYTYDTTRQDPHWCDYSPEADGAYKEVAQAPALWCDGIFSMGDNNPRDPEKAYRYQFRRSAIGEDGSVVHGGFWEGPVVGYCFLPADRNVWYIHLNLSLSAGEMFRFRISEARSLSDTYATAGYDVADGNKGLNADADRELLPFENCMISRGIALGKDGLDLQDAGGFISKSAIDTKVPMFSIKAPEGGLNGFYTLCINNADPANAVMTLAPSLFAVGSAGFVAATGSAYGDYDHNPTGNPTAEFLYDTDGKYKLLMFLQSAQSAATPYIGFNISSSINVSSLAGDQFWDNCLVFMGGDSGKTTDDGKTKYEDFSPGFTYGITTKDQNPVSGLQLQWGEATGYHTVELSLDEKHKVTTLTIENGNTLQKVQRGYQPPRIYINDVLTTLEFDRGYNCWITEFVAPAEGDVTYRRRPFWGGEANAENVRVTDTEHDSDLIPGRQYQLIVDNSTKDRTVTCREMPVYITGYSKTFGVNAGDETGWNSNTNGQFVQMENGIYYFPVRFKGSCEFGISKKRGPYWENFDDGRAFNETGAILKEDGKSQLMEVPFGQWRPYEGFGAPKGQNFNWKFNDELNSDQESWYIVVVDVNTKQVSVQRPGLTPVISDFRISPMDEDMGWMNEPDMFSVDNQPCGAVLGEAIVDPVRYTRLNHISCRLSFTSEYQMPGVFESELKKVSINGKELSGVSVDGGEIDFIDYTPEDNYEFLVVTNLKFPIKDNDGNVIVGEFTTEENNIELTRHLGQRFASPQVSVGSSYPIRREAHYDGQIEVNINVEPSTNDIDERLHVYSGFELGERSHNISGLGNSTREYRGYLLAAGSQMETSLMPLDSYEAFDGNNYGEKQDWSGSALAVGKMPLHIGYITESMTPYDIYSAKVNAMFYAHYPVLCSDNGGEFSDAAGKSVSKRAVASGRHISRIDAPTEEPVEFVFPIRGILSSLEEIEQTDSLECTYFDLEGRPVDVETMAPGIYVRMTNGTAEKIMIR